MNVGYIVCRDRMPLTASHFYDNLPYARAEAERLCRREGAKFLVFALIGEIVIAEAPVTWQWALPPAAPVPSTCTGSGSGWCDCQPDTEDTTP